MAPRKSETIGYQLSLGLSEHGVDTLMVAREQMVDRLGRVAYVVWGIVDPE